MSSYDYKCSKCGVVYTVERSIHAEADAPLCCLTQMERIWTVPPVKFNTTGFDSTGG